MHQHDQIMITYIAVGFSKNLNKEATYLGLTDYTTNEVSLYWVYNPTRCVAIGYYSVLIATKTI